MSGSGYRVDSEALERITRGINLAIDELKEFGFDVEASQQERYASNTPKTLRTATAGSPYLSPEEVEQRSWSDTLKDNPVSHVMNADWSAESIREGAVLVLGGDALIPGR